MKVIQVFKPARVLWFSLILTATPALAQTDATRLAELEAKTTTLIQELAALRAELESVKQSESAVAQESLRTEVIEAKQIAQRAEKAVNGLTNTTSVTHLAGYAAAGYTDQEGSSGSFSAANFNPIFHFQYGDRILWESELEIEIEESGETEVALEYSTIDVFLNDYFVFTAGKFISPIGNFRQNLHPSWINKLPSAPPGFGHDGAAPLAEVGFQLRGGVLIGEQSRFGYSGYIGNGPKLEGEDGEIHGIDTDGFSSDADDEKIIGGRFSFLPVPKLELAISGAFGDAAVVENDKMDFDGDPSRGYQVLGVDAAYQWDDYDFRAEYIQQDIDNKASSIAPEGGKWETWYVQGARKFAKAKWEGVLRYTEYTSPHAEQSQDQWAVGLNYLLAPNAILKVGYEFNDGVTGEETDADRWMLQIAYGY